MGVLRARSQLVGGLAAKEPLENCNKASGFVVLHVPDDHSKFSPHLYGSYSHLSRYQDHPEKVVTSSDQTRYKLSNMDSFIVRPRNDGDIDGCVSALSVLYETEQYPLGANRNLKVFLTDKKNQHCWIAVAETDDGSTIAGHVSTSSVASDVGIDLWQDLYPDTKNVALLSRLFVLPQHRGAGVAAKLIEAAVAFSAEQNVRLLLSVAASSQAAVRLYRRLGWTEYGKPVIVLPDGGKVDAIAFASPQSI